MLPSTFCIKSRKYKNPAYKKQEYIAKGQLVYTRLPVYLIPFLIILHKPNQIFKAFYCIHTYYLAAKPLSPTHYFIYIPISG